MSKGQPRVVADRFELEVRTGGGASGAVWRARDRRTGALAAVKLLHGHADAQRFEREAAILAELEHPHIVRYIGRGITSDDREPTAYLAMEWLEGESLAARLSRGPLAIDEALVLAERVAAALAVAHARGVVHRDIKPSNLLLVGGAAARVQIVDFGIARVMSASMTRTGVTLGTPGYMAPEQVRGDRTVDARADVYSLGCVLFHCIAGRPVFIGADAMTLLLRAALEDAPRLSRFVPAIAPAVDALVARMLSRDPAARPDDGAGLCRELASIDAAPEDLPPVSVSRGPPLGASERRSTSLVLVSANEVAEADTGTEAVTVVTAGGALEEARVVVQSMGEQALVLANGTLLVTLSRAAAANDLAARAARCALATRDVMPAARVAVVTGLGETKGDRPVGEISERAASLLGRANPSSIVIDDATAALLDTRFVTAGESGDRTLVGERDVPTALRTLLGRPTPCVGREREIEVLQALLEECVREPRAGCALVTGEAGIGKSRLVHELLRRGAAAHPALEIWRARADRIRDASPFALLSMAFRQAAALDAAPTASGRRNRLVRRATRHVSASSGRHIVEFLGELMDGAPSQRPSPGVMAARRDAVAMRERVRSAWLELIAAECRAHPLLLVFEDLHQADAATIDAIDMALDRLHDLPLLVIGVARPDILEGQRRLWPERELTHLRLAPLTSRAAQNLVRQALGVEAPQGIVTAIVQRAGGNAFYLEELVRAAASGAADTTPETVLAMAEARLLRLGASARRVLRAASIHGQRFQRDALAQLLPEDERAEALDRCLRALVADEALEAHPEPGPSGVYSFRHALVREAAYATLTDEDRRRGHALAARWLVRQGDADPVVLAEHFDRAGERQRAATWLARAAQQALQRGDVHAARRLADRAVGAGAAGPALGDAHLVQAEAHRHAGDKMEALRCAAGAIALIPAGSAAWYDAMGELAHAAGGLGDRARLEAAARALLEAVPAPDARGSQLLSLARVVIQLYQAGQAALGEEVFARIDAEPPADDDDALPAATVHLVRAQRAMYAGELGGYAEHLQAWAQRLERASLPTLACSARGALGYALAGIGAYAEAETELRAAIADADRMGMANAVAEFRHNLGLVLAHRGQIDEGEQVERLSWEAFQRTGHARMEAACRIYLARILLLRGAVQEAEAVVRVAIERSQAAPPLAMMANAVLAEARLARGDAAEARQAAQRALSLLESYATSVEEGEAYCRRIHAETLVAAGDAPGGRAAIERARRRILEAAAKISDAGWRRSFLEEARDNRAALALAHAWCAGP